MLDIFFPALLGVIAAQASPGPNLLAVASIGLSQGRRYALLVATGVATGVCIWALAFAAGLSTVFIKFPDIALMLRFVGACYLLYIAVKAIYSAYRGVPSSIHRSSLQLTERAAYGRGILVVLTNPKAAMMWAAVSAYLLGSGLSAMAVLLFAPLASITALIIYSAYGVLFSSRKAQRLYFRTSRVFEIVFGVAFGTLGYKLLLDGIKEIRQ